MSLQVWLPLNGDLRNNGVKNIKITNNGATVNDNGKIGKCYSFNNAQLAITAPLSTFTPNFSICCWIYVSSLGNGYAPIFCSRTATSGKGIVLWLVGNAHGIRFDDGEMHTTNNVWTENQWFHICWTRTSSENKLYKNGELIYSTTSSILSNIDSIAGIGRTSNYYLNGKLNDIRIYDHCLSTAEVKEISRGLIVHYPLDNPYNASNLIENGFGQNGTAHWSGSGQSSITEIPPNTTVKRSFAGYQSDYVKINSFNSYTISCYLKTTGTTSGTTYPSIMPYDIDKKFIATQNCPEGFNNAYRTTLAQPLKKGDTVIYVTDLSAWTTAANNYYNYVAIFGYKDSTGHLYPDMGYTQDSPAFAVYGSTKTNINKTNNTITLNAAYTGADRPAGTVICQATAGSTYNYPFGGIAISTVTDWVFKTATLTPNSSSRLRYSVYWKWLCFGGNIWHAGIKLTDNTWMSNTVYDCSGNGYNGTIIDTLDISSDSPRYSKCGDFNGITNGIKIDNLQISDILNTSCTVSFWIKPNNETGKRSVFFSSYSGISWSFEKTTSNYLRLWWNGNPDITCTSAGIIADDIWTLITVTKNSTSDIKVYINGILKQTITTNHSNLTFPTTFRIGRDTRSNDGTPYAGLMSDFRLYATVLSADEIKELYQTSAKIDNTRKLHTYSIVEDSTKSSSSITRQGLTIMNNSTSGFIEDPTLSNLSITKTGQLKATEIIEN